MSTLISPFSELLGTNYIPSNQEREHICQFLAEPEHEAQTVRTKVSQLQKQLAEAKTRREELEATILQHRRLFTPFRRIPDNILSTIFLHSLPHQWNAAISISEPPLRLSYVCKKWRRVAFNTPDLWAALHIASLKSCCGKQTKWKSERHASHLQAISQWLGRSGDRPLSVSMDRYLCHFDTYLQFLLSFSHRWFKIRLDVNDSAISRTLASISPEDVPVLEVLTLKFRETTAEIQPLWESSGGLMKTKSLRTVFIRGFPSNLANIGLDWSHLTSLKLCEPHMADCASSPAEAYMIFSTCKNLVHLTIAIADPIVAPLQYPFARPGPTLFLPHLQTFSVNDRYYFTVLLFRAIDAPSLNSLFYSTIFWPSPKRPSPLVTLLSRNGGSVHTLTVDPNYMSREDLVNCSESAPLLANLVCRPSSIVPSKDEREGLKRLERTGESIHMQKMLEYLEPMSDGQCLLPRMQSITITRYSYESNVIHEDAVLSFLRKRMEAATSRTTAVEILSLKKVDISLGYFDQKKLDIPSLLADYTRDGLDLRLTDYFKKIQYTPTVVADPGVFCQRAGIKSPKPLREYTIYDYD
ncbi:hypothetical protein BDN70DRAFT_838299 [Pholiota conissans]|uniref:F-box domain-containing protein n=1 Tax=Pholiota conissans TaxID=109636 RepID=A0A9P5YXT3_9AGAR|nr:hypothetical protein BDN70DRAFT_838299 [Pholiota conissans]